MGLILREERDITGELRRDHPDERAWHSAAGRLVRGTEGANRSAWCAGASTDDVEKEKPLALLSTVEDEKLLAPAEDASCARALIALVALGLSQSAKAVRSRSRHRLGRSSVD